MKKAIALLAALVVLTSTAFAQLAPTMSGEAETQWGIDTDTGAQGFENDTDITVTIPLVTDESVMSEGEGATGYGEITGAYIQLNLEDFNFGDYDDDEAVFEDDGDIYTDGITGDEGSIYAKIDFGNGLFVEVGDADGVSADMVTSGTDYTVTPDWDEDAGMTIGYDADMFYATATVANAADGWENSTDDDEYWEDHDDYDVVEFLSDETWVVADYNTDYSTAGDGYVVGATVGYATDAFSIDVELGSNAMDSSLTDYKTGVAVELGLMAGPATITVPVDYVMSDISEETYTAMELMPSVEAAFGAATVTFDFQYSSIAKELINPNLDAYNDAVYDYNAATSETTISYANLFSDDYSAMVAGLAVEYALDDATTAGIEFDFTISEATAGSAVTYTAADTYTEDGADDDTDDDLGVTVTYSNAAFAVSAGHDDVLDLELENFNLDFDVTAVAGLEVNVETELWLDNGSEEMEIEIDEINFDFTSELTGIENTTFTINWSDIELVADDNDLGEFYVGATIAF